MLRSLRRRPSGDAGFTLAEVLVAAGLMGMLAYATSTIYFSVLRIHEDSVWRLVPYDEATAAVQRVSDDLREAMLIEYCGPDYIVAVVPQKDANGDYLLTLGDDGYTLTQGDRIVFFLSDETGALGADGNCLWRGIRPQGQADFTRSIKIADDIHPEFNPPDPDTGQPRSMFIYWPDDTRLWGVEIWMTSTTVVRGETKTQTGHSEVYLRNL